MKHILSLSTLIVSLLFSFANASAAPRQTLDKTTEGEEKIFPAGTIIPVEVDKSMVASELMANAKFSGTVSMDVISDDGHIIAQGTKVQGTVIEAKGGGRAVGKASITLSLSHIKVGDKYCGVNSHILVLEGEQQAANTARRTAVGAGVGAAFGGGKGAGKGAAIGGGLSLLSAKGDIKVPAGYVLQFKVSEPLKL